MFLLYAHFAKQTEIEIAELFYIHIPYMFILLYLFLGSLQVTIYRTDLFSAYNKDKRANCNAQGVE